MTNTGAWEDEGGASLTPSAAAARPRIHGAAEAIQAGSILIEEGAPLPESVLLRADPYSGGWSAVTGDRSVFEDQVQKAGLTFFFMAGEIEATVFGSDLHKALRRALGRLIADVRSQDCNGIEITRIESRSFLGLPCVSVYAHPRHLQKGLVFSGLR